MTLLYTPLDIKFDMPPAEDIVAWFDANKIYDPDYWVFQQGRHEWALAAASQPVTNWQRIKPYEDWLAQNHIMSDKAELTFAPGFATMFPGLVDCIMQLPFVEIGAVGLLKQLKEIEPHVDTFDPTMPTEPRRYLVLLTPPAENTFYILKNDIPEVVPVHPDYRAFAFNSTDTTHGAIAPSGIKILMSVVGILDHDAHAALITRSMDKFKEWTIFL